MVSKLRLCVFASQYKPQKKLLAVLKQAAIKKLKWIKLPLSRPALILHYG